MMMEASSEQQACAICLENLLPRNGNASASSLLMQMTAAGDASVKIGAVVPCGHVFHQNCYQRWESAQRRRNYIASTSSNSDDSSTSNANNNYKCKCPMCNAPCDNFVQLFLGEHRDHGTLGDHGILRAAAAVAAAETGDEDESILLLARTCHDSAKRLDRVKDKLNKHKKENRALEQKLKEERRHNEESMERTMERRRAWKRQQVRLQQDLDAQHEANKSLQEQLEKRKEDHRKDRRQWKKDYKKLEEKLVKDLDCTVEQHLEQVKEWTSEKIKMENEIDKVKYENETLMNEIDRTIELQVQERRNWERQQKALQEELAKAREERAKAEARVAKAVHGISQMHIYNDIRVGHLQFLANEKAALEREVEELKAATEEEIVFDCDSEYM